MKFWRTVSVAVIAPLLGFIASAEDVEPVELNAGDEAPDFTLPGTDDEDYKLSDLLKDGPVVLAWFPKADTPGCTLQCKSITKDADLIREYKVNYFMISVDTKDDNVAFAEKYSANFTILSDETKDVAKDYGVLSKFGFAKRHTFYIGTDGKILKVDRKVSVSTSAEDMAKILEELKVDKVEET